MAGTPLTICILHAYQRPPIHKCKHTKRVRQAHLYQWLVPSSLGSGGVNSVSCLPSIYINFQDSLKGRHGKRSPQFTSKFEGLNWAQFSAGARRCQIGGTNTTALTQHPQRHNSEYPVFKVIYKVVPMLNNEKTF